MEQLQLAIALPDGQTLRAEPRPEDERRLADILGDRATIELASNDADDIEGHSIADEVLLDVEGHAIAIRLPNGADAKALRRALAVGAVTATIVGAGAIAALQQPAATPASVQVPAAENVLQVPAPALRAQEAEEASGQQFTVVVPPQAVLDVDNPAVPAPALHALEAENLTGPQSVVVPPQSILDANNPAVPAPALHAAEAEQAGQIPVAPLVQTGQDNVAVPAPAQHALDGELQRNNQLTPSRFPSSP